MNPATPQQEETLKANHAEEPETTRERRVIPIQQVETPQAEQYPQLVTIETKQEVSPETTESTKVVACIEEKENDDAVF